MTRSLWAEALRKTSQNARYEPATAATGSDTGHPSRPQYPFGTPWGHPRTGAAPASVPGSSLARKEDTAKRGPAGWGDVAPLTRGRRGTSGEPLPKQERVF